jgi:hypothetical protein
MGNTRGRSNASAEPRRMICCGAPSIEETIVEGVPLRVVELTGEPGDMVFCHPATVHCVAPNRGARPRFMRIKTAAGRRPNVGACT